ncbi:thioredoxin-like protein [Cunninghamella echinulata]|nr:thioredoxin-like protein [Cunninghamella echinulata]
MILPYTVKDVSFKNTKSRSKFRYLNKRCGVFSFVFLIFFTICLVIYNSHYLPSNMTELKNNFHDNNNSKLQNEINTLIASHQVIVFSKTYCPFSKKAKELLNTFQFKIPYHIIEVDLRDEAAEIKQILGIKSSRYTFPNIFVNGISIGGASELETMNENGDLKKLLIAEGVITD